MRIIKKCLYCLLALFSVLFILIALLPSLVSTSYGKNTSIHILEKFYPGKIEVSSLSLGWFSGIHIQDIHVRNSTGKPIFECEKIDLDKPLISWIYSWYEFGNIKIISPSVFLQSQETHHSCETEPKIHKPHTHTSSSKEVSSNDTPLFIPGIQGTIAIENAKILSPKNEKPSSFVSDGSVTLSVDLLHDSSGSIQAKIGQGEIAPTPLSVSFTLTGNPFKEGKAAFSLLLDKTPTELVAVAAENLDKKLGIIARESLGDSFSYSLNGTILQGKSNLLSHLKSENFTSDIEASFFLDSFSLQKGSLLQGTVTPALGKALGELFNQKVELLQSTPIDFQNKTAFTFDLNKKDFITVYNLSFATLEPFHVRLNNVPLDLSCNAELSGTAAQKKAFVQITNLKPHEASVRFDLTTTNTGTFYDTLSTINISGAWPKIVEQCTAFEMTALTGPEINLAVKTEGRFTDVSQFSFKNDLLFSCAKNHSAKTQLTLSRKENSPLIEAQAEGNFVPDATQKKLCSLIGNDLSLNFQVLFDIQSKIFTLSKMNVSSATLSGQLSDLTASTESLLLATPARFSLTQKNIFLPQLTDGSLDIALAPFSYHIKNSQCIGNPLELTTTGKLTFSRFPDPIHFSIPSKIDVQRKKIEVAPLLSFNETPFLQGGSTIDLSKNTPAISGSISIKDFPVSFIDSLAQEKLSDLVGKNIAATLDFGFTSIKEQNNHVSLKSQGDFWNATATILLDDGVIHSGRSGITFDATLSPEYLKKTQSFFKKPTDLSLRKDVSLHASLVSFQVPLKPILEKNEAGLASLFSALKLKADLSLSNAEIVRAGAPIAHIAPLKSELLIDGAIPQIEFHLSPSSQEKSVSPEIDLSVKDFIEKSAFSSQNASLTTKFTVATLPLRLIDMVAPGKADIAEEIVGKTCTIQGNCSVKKMQSGLVQADITSEHTFAHLDGTIKEGNLTLNTPVTASLEITKRAGETLLKDVSPLVTSAIHTEKPITVTIDPKNVSIPLQTFSFNNLNIPKITVDLGKMVVKNGGALKIILALLKQGNAANSDTVNVWLTPITLQIMHGFVTCQRSDALVADGIHMITWGTVDLVRDNLDMTVAIPMETLQRVGCQIISTHPERGLQIPIKGPSANPKVETTRAAAKLAGAGTMQASSDQRLRLLGGLIQAAAQVGEEDKPIPQQVTQPLPWER